METVLLVGIPASGKSSFYRERFFHSHMRLSLDLLKTRYREARFLALCLETDLRFVVDNTNPTRADRRRYLESIRRARVRYRTIAYYFEAPVGDCLARNARRAAAERVPEAAIRSAARRLEIPTADEGFDQLWRVRIQPAGFEVQPWPGDQPSPRIERLE